MRLLISEDKEKYIVNNRYLIYKDTGVVFDNIKGLDIPRYIFDLRDFLINKPV